MNTKDILLVGVGLVMGYLVYKKYSKNKQDNTLPISNNGTGETLVDPKVFVCEEKWNVIASTIKPASATAYNAQKEAFISECLTSTVPAGTGGLKPSK
jgi:hypothetical protein